MARQPRSVPGSGASVAADSHGWTAVAATPGARRPLESSRFRHSAATPPRRRSMETSMTDSAPTAAPTRPMTGAEYLESVRDGREIWIYGERVKDVTTHPAFRNTVRMIARLYDALHDPAQKAVLTTETDTGSGGFTHPFFKAPRTREDLVASRDAIAAWQLIGF